jgi:hypothetical protein
VIVGQNQLGAWLIRRRRTSRLPGCTAAAQAARTGRKGFTETGCAELLDAARQQLGSSIVLIWGRLNPHLSGATAEQVAARDWLASYVGS